MTGFGNLQFGYQAKIVRRTTIVLGVTFLTVVAGCSQRHGKAGDEPELRSQTKNRYIPPTAEELAPMRPEYLAQLAKIDEPPEMAEKLMRVRKPASSAGLKVMDVMSALGSPEKATHRQRATAINNMLELAKSKDLDDLISRTTLYSYLATLACIDGADAQTVIEYASNAIGEESGDALALRARMYLRDRKVGRALDDLEKIMADDNASALVGGDVDPRKNSNSCGWSIADFDAFGNNPRALAAKGLYLSSFLPYGAGTRGTVKEAEIRHLYALSAASWRSPVPHYLVTSLYGFGSQHSMNSARCIRSNTRGSTPDLGSACESYDEGVLQEIRELTMALVINPTFAPALSGRADKYLTLAQGSYADGKPSRTFFELAIKDYTAALDAGSKARHTLYCDRALAQASIGSYQDAARGYEQGMKCAKDGIEESSFVYTQLAGVYAKMGRFNEAADTITQAIKNSSGGGINLVIVLSGIQGFRALYPEYDLLPDEILADTVRRRFFPNYPKSWNDEFISGASLNGGKVSSSILPELYITRGDAFRKAGRKKLALADYRRVKSNAWREEGPLAPRNMYFNKRGDRNPDLPEPFPAPPPKG
jgi:tetratricopeptide (TPR) repeat protein